MMRVVYVSQKWELAHERGRTFRGARVSGFELQAQLSRLGVEIPIVFITGHRDIPMSVKAMKSGAVDFLTKPFRDQEILDAVAAALERDRKRRSQEKSNSDRRAAQTSRGDNAFAVLDRGMHAAMSKRRACRQLR